MPRSTDIQQENTHRKLFSTFGAARTILGGTDTQGYWGFEFDDFASKFQNLLCERIGNPLDVPWQKDVYFKPDDYIELATAIDSLDFTSDPAGHIDEPLALEFAKRSNIFGINGPIGSGKDSVAEALAPYGFVRLSFSDPLRIAGALTYGIPLRYFLDRSLKDLPLPNSPMSPRRVIQLLGTEVVRAIHDRIWVKRNLLRMASAMHDLSGYSKNSPERLSVTNGIKAIVPDVRFQNEADFVRFVDGRVVKLSRPTTGVVTPSVNTAVNHSSELGVSDSSSDIHLVNIGSLTDFHAESAKVLLAAIEPKLPKQNSRLSARRKP